MANYGVILQATEKGREAEDSEWVMRGGWLLYCMAGELWPTVFGLATMRSSLAASVPRRTGVGTTAVWTSGMSTHSGPLSLPLS